MSGAIGCGGTHVQSVKAPTSASIPDRNAVHTAAEQAWAGLQALDAACAAQVRRSAKTSEFAEGTGLSERCLDFERPAETDRHLLMSTLETWQPEAAARVGCYVTGILAAYDGLLDVLQARGYTVSPQVEDGRASAAWIASLSARRGGRCVGS